MKKLGLIILLLTLTGCTTLEFPDYIKADHPYVRKITGKYQDIVDAVAVVLFKEGWKIQRQVNPSIYERREGGEDQSQDVLFFTEIKQHPKVVYSTFTHLNVYVHPIAEGAEVEVRYEAISSTVIKQFHGSRNDKVSNRLLDKIEQELANK
ncbi:MAG: hypothetical protein WCH62_03150 [Candidatus Omnitrophota bacterium]